jgi:beta-N-acetylhexosaminidase
MVLICNSPDKADQILAGLDSSLALTPAASAERLARLMPVDTPKDWATLQQDKRYQSAKAAVLALR